MALSPVEFSAQILPAKLHTLQSNSTKLAVRKTVSCFTVHIPIHIETSFSAAQMADINVEVAQWRQVEVGRIIFFTNGTYIGRLAAIAEIIDHKRVRETKQAFRLMADTFYRFSLMGLRRRKSAPYLAMQSLFRISNSHLSSYQNFLAAQGPERSRRHGRRAILIASGKVVRGLRRGNSGNGDAL